MVEGAPRDKYRVATAVVLVVSALALLGDAIISLLPRSDDAALHRALTRTDLIIGYSHVRPGRTRASQLSQFGFDTSSTGTQVLSYLGMMERFVPHDSARFDKLDPAIKGCIAVQDRCTALVFRTASQPRAATTGGLFAALALEADSALPPPQVTLLIRDGRVAFKMISGIRRVSQPDQQSRAIPVPFRMAY